MSPPGAAPPEVSRPDVSGPGVSRRTTVQVVWNYLVFALSKSSTLIMTIVLARLLTPADFGLFALALVVVNLFDYVKDLGVGAALVQSRERWSRIAPTGLTLSVAFGVLAGGGLAATADLTAAALGHPALAPLVRVLAVALAVSALSTVPAARMRRRLDFRRRLLPEFAGAVAKTVLSVWLAVAGFGVWSLVYGQLAAVAVTTALYWLVARQAPRPGWDRAAGRGLVGFGMPVTAVTLVAFAIYNVAYVIVGIRLGDAELGLFSLAYRLPELIVLNLCVVVSDVVFSAMSRMQDDRPGLAGYFTGVLTAVVAVTAPIGVAMAVTATDVVALMYGPAFAGAADDLALLALFAVVYSASFHSGDVYKAIGRPGILTAINVAKLALMVLPLWFATAYGTAAVAATLLAVELVHFAIRMLVVRAVLGIRLRVLLAAGCRPLPAAAAMALAMLGVAALLPGWPPAVRIALLGALGLLVYPAVLAVTAPGLARRAVRVLHRRSARPPGTVDPTPAPTTTPLSPTASGGAKGRP